MYFAWDILRECQCENYFKNRCKSIGPSWSDVTNTKLAWAGLARAGGLDWSRAQPGLDISPCDGQSAGFCHTVKTWRTYTGLSSTSSFSQTSTNRSVLAGVSPVLTSSTVEAAPRCSQCPPWPSTSNTRLEASVPSALYPSSPQSNLWARQQSPGLTK